jgi:hypothetical protein
MATPPSFPVWIVGADGRDEYILDTNGYRAAVAAGAAPFSPVLAAKAIALGSGSTRAILPVPHSTLQTAPGPSHEPHN